MQDLPQNVYSAAAARAIDRCAIESMGVRGLALMTRAGERLFRDALGLGGKQWCVVCGGGNNGGDGYVIARLAHESGLSVSLISITEPDRLVGDAALAKDAYLAVGGRIARWSDALPSGQDLIIDAIFGTGLSRPVDGKYRAAIEAINSDPAPVYAVDIPSGLDADTGEVLGVAVRASRTMSFVALKTGALLGSGPDYCGALRFDDLDIAPRCLRTQTPLLQRLLAEDLVRAFPPRRRTGNKGLYGRLAVLAGGPGMPGAALLAGTAALRAGAGRVTLMTHPDHAASLAVASPELMAYGVTEVAELDEGLAAMDCVVFGPGLGQSDWAEDLYAAMKASARPAVWDADALNLLARDPHYCATRILTPHPGEAARLLDVTTADIQQDRLGALAALEARYGGIVVLKGAGTLVSNAGGAPWICSDGNPGMAAPGMGDVLSGIIGACVVQKVGAHLGVLLHARAGDQAARLGERGTLASDLFAPLRKEVNP